MIKRIFGRSASSQSVYQNQSVLFVHIPKTAGTSYKNSLSESMNLYRDYGESSPETHASIRQLYKNDDFFLFKSRLPQGSAICGHVSLMKYADLVNIERITTFVREPIEQIVSHYNHFVSQYQYKHTFETFYSDSNFINLQSRYLANFPIGLLGFVGLTENYDDSIEILEQHLHLSIQPKKSNISHCKKIELVNLTEKQRREIWQLNNQDVALYRQAYRLYHQRKAIKEQGKIWTYLHAHVNKNLVLNGCAFYASSTKAVNLEVLVNGKFVQTIEAKNFYNAYPKFNFPRERYISFHLPLKGMLDLETNYVEVKVISTGQSRKIRVNKS